MYIVTIREVRTVVTAATLFPPERRPRDQAAHRQDARRPPVLRIERWTVLEPRVEFLPRRFEHGQGARQAVAIPEQADVLPHQSRQFHGIGTQPRSSATRRRRRRSMRRLTAGTFVHSHRASRAGAKDQAFQKRIAGEAIGAVHTCTRNLARGEESRDSRSSIQIRPHSAHHVVGRGPDRNAITGEIQPGAPAGIGDQREPLVDEIRIEPFQRKVHRLIRTSALAGDGARDAIARSEIPGGLVACHERFAGRVHELRAFTSQRFGQQKPRLSLDHQRRRMELHELQVDDLGAGLERHGNSVSRGDVRVRRFVIDLTRSTRREKHASGARHGHSAVIEEKPRAEAASVFDHEADDPRMILGRHARQLRSALPEHPADLATGCIVRVQNSSRAMRRLHRERRLPVRRAVESNTPRHQLSNEAGTVLDENLDCEWIAESVAGRNRVCRMQLRCITRTDGRRNASLRMTGVAFSGSGLGEDEHVAVIGDLRGRTQRGDAAADDEKVRAKLQAAADAAILPSQKTMRSRQPQAEAVQLQVRTSTGTYTIEIAAGSSNRLRVIMDAARVPARRFIVSSQIVWGFHGDDLRSAADEEPILLPDGERYKQLATVGRIYDALIRANADRSSAIIAIGGGVTGDIAGFAAATYLRGIPVVQVPTTLLAQVDSAVGGKVGVNHPMGKNLIGAFHPPAAVIIDPSLLSTLPRREFRAGLYEVVKYGVIASRALFDRTASELTPVFAREPAALLPIVSESCRIKAEIVEQDERESGVRRLLNFGHTAGHALEAVTKYRRFLHGEAVAWGMLAAAELAATRGALPKEDRETLASHIMQMGPLPPVSDLSAADIIEATRRDKKVIDGKLHFVLPTKIGAATTVTDVSTQELTRALLAIGLKE